MRSHVVRDERDSPFVTRFYLDSLTLLSVFAASLIIKYWGSEAYLALSMPVTENTQCLDMFYVCAKVYTYFVDFDCKWPKLTDSHES